MYSKVAGGTDTSVSRRWVSAIDTYDIRAISSCQSRVLCCPVVSSPHHIELNWGNYWHSSNGPPYTRQTLGQTEDDDRRRNTTKRTCWLSTESTTQNNRGKTSLSGASDCNY
uniref:Uncharacterized protein n=1 Tax=Heterorhabditis bacteriophora TaxID=37862 RepID=A0A1I7X763_HETBA